MEKSILHIASQALRTMESDAIQSFPNECCGFMFGNEKSGVRTIERARPVINSKEGDQRRRFEISPLDYLRAEQYAAENGLDLLGVYHSHPNHPAIASETDLSKAMPWFSYVILSIMEGNPADVKSWKLKDEVREFAEEEVRIFESAPQTS
ncbi:MAG: M67 family peptidase [Bacteroidetes bacterium]|nr:MAG: M67 family peptidase [Bacteroidota bacterium]